MICVYNYGNYVVTFTIKEFASSLTDESNMVMIVITSFWWGSTE